MIKRGYFIITDITGYTAYLSKSELDHAQEILKSLFDAQTATIKPPLTISNYQGDAIFLYVPEGSFLQTQTLIEFIEEIYFAFSRTLELMQFNTSCTCNACKNIPTLDLKIFIHYGDYILQQVSGGEELMGPDVILTHHMMKNQVVSQTNIRAYALFTAKAAEALELATFYPDLIKYRDDYEHVGEVDMFVQSLKTQWEKEQEKIRNVVTKEEAWVGTEVAIDAPPVVVWDYFTKFDIKLAMLGFSVGSRLDNLGRRIREESSFHCAHGDLEFRYKIVDWYAFKYFTCHDTGPNGIVYDVTYHFAPTDKGTLFACYVRTPESGPVEETKELMQTVWDQSFPKLKPYIEQAFSGSRM